MDNETNNVNSSMNNPVSSPTPTPTPVNTPIGENKEGSAGPVIGTIIILAVIVLGGFYFWSQRVAAPSIMDEAAVEQAVTDITTQSQADNISSIEADLNATDVNKIGRAHV